MQAIWCNLSALAVACIFYSWRAYSEALMRRERQLRERVSYLLWVVAHQIR
jgi:hypothetical protein